MEGSVAVSVFGHGQALPLHARIQSPAEEGEDAMVAAFAPGAPLGQGEVREEKLRELRGGEWDRNRWGGRLFWHCGHHQWASCEDGCARPWETVPSNVIRW